MARKTFFSFHYDVDSWRASQVRNMGALEGNAPCSDNDWETIKKRGDRAIEKWISEQLLGRSCTVVLVGGQTANRKWVIHEIKESWNAGKGIVGVRIHGLKDQAGNLGGYGDNPFDQFSLKTRTQSLSSVVRLYDPAGLTSSEIYKTIKDNIASWVEEAISIRSNN